MEEGRKGRRERRMEARAQRMEALLAALTAGEARLGPLLKIVERIEDDLTGKEEGPVAEAEAELADLGLEPDDLLPGAGQKAGTLRLALAVHREIGKRLPLETILGFLPGLAGNIAEKGLLLPIALALATSYRLRTDPAALQRRIQRLENKRARLRRGED